jgi:hypothetical protein
MSKSISKQSNRKKVRFPYTIIIPSVQQPDILHTHTLSLLRAYHIPREAIIIAVTDSEQEILYKEKIPSDLYGVIVPIYAPFPSAEFYNRISDRLPEGIPIVYMADNLQGIYEKESYITTPLAPLRNLPAFFKRGFQECEKAHAQMWGIYPVANGHFMSQTVSTQLKHIPGTIWGCFNPGSSAIHLSMDEYIEYQRSILYWNTFGALVRLNWVTCIQEHPSSPPSRRSAKKLAKLYPDLVTLEHTSNGHIHVRLHSV